MNSVTKLLAATVLISTTLIAPVSQAQQTVQEKLSRNDLIYHILVAETAIKRGELESALTHYRTAAYASADPRVAARAANIALFLNDNDSALDLAQRWYDLAPDNEKARQTLILGLMRNKRLAEAIGYMRDLLQNTPDLTQGFASLSSLLGQVKDPDAVFRVTQSLRQHYPDSAAAHYFFALAALDLQQDDTALTSLDTALALKADWHEARLLKARIMVRRGAVDEAVADLEQALTDYPDDHTLGMGYARLLVAAERLEAARKQFKMLSEQNPDDAEALYALGVLASEAKQYDEAETYFRRVLDLGKRLQETYFELGKLEEARANYLKAQGWYLRVSDDERYMRAQVRAAAMAAHIGEINDMHEHLATLRRENPDSAISLHIAEADILREVKRYQEAFDHLSLALDDYAADEDLLYARALAAEKIDRLDVLERDLKFLIEADPENGHALNALGYTLADRTDRYQEALAYLERAIVLLPEDAAVLDSMGWVKYRLGDYASSLEYLRRAYELNQDPEIVSHLSEVLWHSGAHQEARELWQKAFNEAPDSEYLLKLKERLGFD